MRVTEKAYLAGLIDGEGYIGVTRASLSSSGRFRFAVRVTIGMTNKKIIQYIRNLTHIGSVRCQVRKRPHKDLWLWTASCNKAAKILKMISRFLILKKKQAVIALDFQKFVHQFQSAGPISHKNYKIQENYWKKSLHLNHRGRV